MYIPNILGHNHCTETESALDDLMSHNRRLTEEIDMAQNRLPTRLLATDTTSCGSQ